MIGGEAVIWDRPTKEKHRTVRGSAHGFTPDGRSLAVIQSGTGTLSLINPQTGEVQWRSALGSALQQAGLAFSPDAKTMIVAWDNVLRLFDSDTGRERFAGAGAHQGMVNAVRYTPDGQTLITAGNDGTIRLSGAGSRQQLKLIADAGCAHLLAVSPDGRALASAATLLASAPAIRVWELPGGRLLRQFSGPATVDRIGALAFSSDGKLILAFSPKLGLKVFDIATGHEQEATQPQFMLQAQERAELGLDSGLFAPGNRYLAICTGMATHVVELASGTEIFSYSSDVMTFTPDGEGLAVATARDRFGGSLAVESVKVASAVEIVNIATGGSKRILVPTERVYALKFSPDGRILAVAAGFRECSIRLYSVEDGREVDALACPATRTHPGRWRLPPMVAAWRRVLTTRQCSSGTWGTLDDARQRAFKVTRAFPIVAVRSANGRQLSSQSPPELPPLLLAGATLVLVNFAIDHCALLHEVIHVAREERQFTRFEVEGVNRVWGSSKVEVKLHFSAI